MITKARFNGEGDPIVDSGGTIAASYQDALRRIPIFSGLSETDLAELLINTTVQEFPRNTMLFEQGETAKRFFIILAGWVRVFRYGRDGREVVLHTLAKDDYFAHSALFNTGLYPANALVLEDARLLVIPGAELMEEIDQNPRLARNIISAMSGRMRYLLDQIEQFNSFSSTERLARFLIKMCDDDATSAVVHLPIDKAQIASQLAMQPETFSRSLSKLRQIGVEVQSNDIVIPDVRRLRSLIGASI